MINKFLDYIGEQLDKALYKVKRNRYLYLISLIDKGETDNLTIKLMKITIKDIVAITKLDTNTVIEVALDLSSQTDEDLKYKYRQLLK